MSSMVFPFATRKYTEHKSQKNEEKRISKYSAYLDDVERKIHEASVLQREEQLKTAPDVQESYTRVMEMLPNLWERISSFGLCGFGMSHASRKSCSASALTVGFCANRASQSSSQ